jgi:hypothetical protein
MTAKQKRIARIVCIVLALMMVIPACISLFR